MFATCSWGNLRSIITLQPSETFLTGIISSVEVAASMPRKRIGRFNLIEKLAETGTGALWRGSDGKKPVFLRVVDMPTEPDSVRYKMQK